MTKILSDIYHGNYTVFNHRNRNGTPFAETLDRINEMEVEIRNALPDAMKEIFDQYVSARADLSDMACEEDFITGCRLGARLMLVAIRDDDMNP